ncbi:hypothetical protein acsn021_06310 [Anaerocolumna cellulosilytica]|uniref:Uncharacterized protein n=1 Tax=Anaerocolumna cellulosilytica TaxID=433286 RepID=A0A6S6R0J0_9FIRM|nr:hypothetical protein [Anaerocolumna cellulosilytica]MBB5198085.1 hypothetical protein [Anaerocolumna cellulosilytica]BCJ93062.1 hypothetical protein acsn021_06310 [Anaerocolumna cellulosilytica]
MNTYKDILNSSSLHHLSRLIRDSKASNVTHNTFTKREEIAYHTLIQNLRKLLDYKRFYQIETYINEYTSELNEIYFNIGMKTGARLMKQLLDNEDKDY